ncbi:hypothetical protein [Brevibacillus antibioticus]|uniref:hypothetical protein n=1 Tax=Brevibacillus antibioticus TaxID=2570228 RepID=UPI0013901BE2|nr:hypothetical protein [Brevibacillus antibioticus]
MESALLNEIGQWINQYGFPVVVAGYYMIFQRKETQSLKDAVNANTEVMKSVLARLGEK